MKASPFQSFNRKGEAMVDGALLRYSWNFLETFSRLMV